MAKAEPSNQSETLRSMRNSQGQAEQGSHPRWPPVSAAARPGPSDAADFTLFHCVPALSGNRVCRSDIRQNLFT